MMKISKLTAVILYGVCAVIWTIRAIVGIVVREYDGSLFIFILNILCAVIWIVAFVIQLHTYRTKK